MKASPGPTRGRFARAGYTATVAVCLVVWLLPLAAVALTSLHRIDDLDRGAIWTWPETLQWSNYATVLRSSRMPRFILNSFLVTVPAVVGTILLSAMAGFALAKHRFAGNRLLLMVFVAGNLVPFQVLMIPVRDLVIGIGLYDSRWALILFHTAFQTGFCTLFMRNFIRDLPDPLLDAARVDGAGEFKVFGAVILPLLRPAIAAMAVLVFTFVWNDYFWSLMLVQSDSVRPVTAGVQALRGMWQTSWNLVAAASLLAALPPVALFFVMQRHMVAGLTFGAPRPLT